MTDGFVHLHNHLEGSYSDSVLRMRSALDRVVELGMTAFALTDHGELALARAFAREAEARGVKPIVGVEAYFVDDAAENIRRRINDRFHLTLLAMDARGYANLVALVSRSWRDNCLMQKLGLVDWRLLEEHGAGLICLSGCLAGPVGWSILKDRPAEADRYYGRLAEIFGDRFYLEVYDHRMAEEQKAAAGILAAARRYDRRAVLTNDCHYLNPADWTLHDTLIKTRFGKPTDFELTQHEYFIKSAAQMRALDLPRDCADATLEVAERIGLAPAEILAPAPDPRLPEEAAFLGRVRPLEWRDAVEKAAGVLRLSARRQRELAAMPREQALAEQPEVVAIADGIVALPARPEPDLSRIVVAPGLSRRVPLRRTEKLLFTMWNEEDCRAAGAEVLPVGDRPELATLARATELYLQGLAEYKKRRFDRARERFRGALELDPDFTNARYQLGLVEYYAGAIPAAREALAAVVEREPDFERLPHLKSYLGWCCFHMNEDETARGHFEQSLAEKEIPGSLLGLGLVLERIGRPEAARATLMRLVEIAPDFPRLATAQRALERLTAPPVDKA